jgi:CheY-like chemotaxis protein
VGRILICEPDPEVRELLRRVVERRGHESVFEPNGLRDLAAVVLEPSDVVSVEIAQTARASDPAIPIVCASIEPPTAGSRKLAPVAHIVKPFTLSEFERALAAAFPDDRRSGRGGLPRPF